MDATGLIVHISRSTQHAAERLMPAVCRIGVSLAKGVVGTIALGIAAKIQGTANAVRPAAVLP